MSKKPHIFIDTRTESLIDRLCDADWRRRNPMLAYIAQQILFERGFTLDKQVLYCP